MTPRKPINDPHPYASLAALRWPLAALSVAMTVRYLAWRATSTLNYESSLHLAISTALLAAEVYGFMSLALFFLHSPDVAHVDHPPLPPEHELPSVDVFVPIYNEPVEILYRTVVGCLALDYPKRLLNVYVLDDGPRPEVRDLAERLGCLYLSRPDRHHAKAGNINAALARSRGQVVMIMDCDHIPVRSFLTETIGYFADRKVALVQLPHHFYNPDTFQRNLHLEQDLTHEQDLFFRVVLAGRQSANAVMFCGSSALLRRSALELIGGIRTETAIEDTHTSMTLQSLGYRGIYHPQILSGALSPESFSGYLTQRMRWTRGGIQIFMLDNPLLKPGLSLLQRMHYFASTLYFFHGWARVVFMLAPLTFLLFSLNPIVADTLELLGYFLPHYVAGQILLMVMSREFRNSFWSDVYEVAASFNLSLMAVVTMLNPTQLVFRVTPKGEQTSAGGRVSWGAVFPHTLVLVLLCVSMIGATARVIDTGLQIDAYLVSSVWSVYNIILLACAIEASRERPRFRKDFRLARRILCQVMFGPNAIAGETTDISESGVSIALPDRWHLPKVCRLRLISDYGEATDLEGEVVRKDWPNGGGTRLGVQFRNLAEAGRQGVVRQSFSPASSWHLVRRPKPIDPGRALLQIATSAVRHRFRGAVRPTRIWPRVLVDIPCELAPNGGAASAGTLRDISATGANVTVPGAAPARGEATISFAMGEERAAVRCRIVRSEPGVDGVKFILSFTDPKHLDIGPLVKNIPGVKT